VTAPNHSVHPTAIRRRAFTLIELLVVIAFIAILVALLFPVLGIVRQGGDQAAGLSNMRQIGAAFVVYAAEHDSELPSPANRNGQLDRWPKALAKYLQDVKVYAAPGMQDNYLVRHVDPLANAPNNTSYLMNGFDDLGGFDDSEAKIRLGQIVSPANTLLLGMQKPGSRQFYMDFLEPPHGNQRDRLELKAYREGSNYAFVDGSARFIAEKDYRDELWLVDKSFTIPSM
jgi:prepilin-type N-terminal cleavage/methylation domain-containing protein/prepilin-type processing-associated H-X9-DG protein